MHRARQSTVLCKAKPSRDLTRCEAASAAAGVRPPSGSNLVLHSSFSEYFSEQTIDITGDPTYETWDSLGFRLRTIPDDLLDFMFDLVNGEALSKMGYLSTFWC
jgi:hypothetical protein